MEGEQRRRHNHISWGGSDILWNCCDRPNIAPVDVDIIQLEIKVD
jgi:hypothetical protein